ncbi:DUF2807 domain-containing protein [Rugamonas sp.]|uniref:GIN domain-containing protein n=1 Tax=Rugamonas sp. TaxID=1926287 RepID=UPI0025CD20BD|nr:DUF2807 domain-containing protein [Rugamonas sp.]
MLAAMLACGAHHALADDIGSESRNVDARAVRVNLDGIINLTVKQGAAPALTIYGDKRYFQRVTVTQDGDTLRIDAHLRGLHIGKPDLRAELTLPTLRELVSGGVGTAEVSGFTGDELRLALDGAGAVKVNAHYKNVTAKLGGVGSMQINAGDSDMVNLDMRGAGQIDIAGNSRTLHARLGGVGSLDAQALRADDVDVDMTGLGSASVYAKHSANLKLSGLGSATVYGKPASRSASAHGMGSVTWQ